MTAQNAVLCELCQEPIRGMSILWRRGFVASCCWSCGMELMELLASGRVNFDAPGAGLILSVIGAPARETWQGATGRLMGEKRPLWEALAKI